MTSDPERGRKTGASGASRPVGIFRTLLAVVCLVLAACERSAEEGQPGQRPEAPQEGGTAALCVPSQPESLDPFVTPDQRASDLAPLLFTPLVRYGDDGEIVPHLARSWAWEEGRRRLILKLREDVRWHDGTPVGAADVAWTLTVASRPDYGYPEASDFSALEAAEARDSSTVVVRFNGPYAPELEPFAMLPILPRHLLGDLSSEDFARAPYHRSPVGSGPFRFVERRSDGTLVFERFEGFPDELAPVYLDRIAVRVVPEASTRMAELRTGGVDACVTVSADGPRLRKLEGLELHDLRPAQLQVLILNTSQSPFRDPRVRRALSAALDRSSIAATVSPLATPATTLVPENSPHRVPELGQPDDHPARADSLLAAAGWTRTDDGGIRRDTAGDELRFTLLSAPPLKDALTVVQADLRKAGIGVDLRFMEFSSFVATIRNPETRPTAMALGFQMHSLQRPDLHGFLHSNGENNFSGYKNPRVDSLLDVAASTTDGEALQAAYHELQREIRRDAPVISTVYVPRVLAVGQRLRGVSPRPNSALATVGQWWIPTERRR